MSAAGLREAGRYLFFLIYAAALAAFAGMLRDLPPAGTRPAAEKVPAAFWQNTFPEADGQPGADSVGLEGREIYAAWRYDAAAPGFRNLEGVAFFQSAGSPSGKVKVLIAFDTRGKILGLHLASHRAPWGLGKYFLEQREYFDFYQGLTLEDLERAAAEGRLPEVPRMRGTSRAVNAAVFQGLRFFAQHQAALMERFLADAGAAAGANPVLLFEEPQVPLPPAALPEPVQEPEVMILPAPPGHGRE